MINHSRKYSKLDMLCMSLDQVVRAVSGKAGLGAQREYPAIHTAEADLSEQERRRSASLMRVNHAGEVSAQALYHGQGLASRDRATQAQMQQAALEEGDHLAWCSTRLEELGSHTSYLNAFWYMGSFVIGLTAGIVGDKWSLGFVAETESQVVKHIESHLRLLPQQDKRSAIVLQQMQKDELFHRDQAIKAGAAILPTFIKILMKVASKVMVKTAYWI